MPLQEWSESTLIAEMNDEPLFSEDFEALISRLESGEDGTPDVILNMLGVSRLNSSNLSQLLRLRKMLISRDRRLRICSVDRISRHSPTVALRKKDAVDFFGFSRKPFSFSWDFNLEKSACRTAASMSPGRL